MSKAPDPASPSEDSDTILPAEAILESLIQAQQLLFRVAAMRDDPFVLQRLALRHLADTLTPSGVRMVLGTEQVNVEWWSE